MFTKKLERIFALVTLGALTVLAYNWYASYRFDHTPLSEAVMQQLEQKEREVIARIKTHYGIDFRVPMRISDNIPGNLYGVTAYRPDGTITILLNKKRAKESLQYLLDDVIAHEYAHALMFHFGYRTHEDGHSQRWQQTCKALGGSRCDRYVNGHDVVMGKLPF